MSDAKTLIVVASSIAILATAALARSVTTIAARDLRCVKCRYSLVGLPLPFVCPECGEESSEARIIVIRRRWAFDRAVFAVLTVLACVVCPWLVIPFWYGLYWTSNYRGRVDLGRFCFGAEIMPSDGVLLEPFVTYAILLLWLAAYCPHRPVRTARRTAILTIGYLTIFELGVVLLGWSAGDVYLSRSLSRWSGCAFPFILVVVVALLNLRADSRRVESSSDLLDV